MRKIPVILVQPSALQAFVRYPWFWLSLELPPSLPPWLTAAWHQSLLAPLLQPSSRQHPAVMPEKTTTLDANGVTTTYFPAAASRRRANLSSSLWEPTAVRASPATSHRTIGRSLRLRYCYVRHDKRQRSALRPVDGADCPTTGAANSKAGLKFIAVRSQLFGHGNFRISLPQPASHDWASVSVVSDPTGCEKNATYGIPSNLLSFYRRPLPATNVIYTTPGVTGPNPISCGTLANQPGQSVQ